MTRRVLVGVDDSQGSRSAMKWAAGYATEHDAELIAVHVLTYSSEFWRDLPPMGMATWRLDLKKRLSSEWTDPARQLGATVHCLLTEDDSIAAGITKIAQQQDVDLIVMGAPRDLDLVERLVGSVTYRVSHTAHRPVAIIPAHWGRDDEREAAQHPAQTSPTRV